MKTTVADDTWQRSAIWVLQVPVEAGWGAKKGRAEGQKKSPPKRAFQWRRPGWLAGADPD